MRGEVFIAIATCFGGLAYIISKEVLEHLSPEAAMFLRYSLGATAIILICPQSLLKIDRVCLKAGFLTGSIWAMSMLILYSGLKRTDTGIAAFLCNSEFITIPIIEFLLFRACISAATLIRIGIGLIGALCLSMGRGFGLGGGELLLAVSSIGFSLMVVLNVRQSKISSVYSLGVVMMLVAAFETGLICLVKGESISLRGSVLWQIIFLGFFVTGLNRVLVLHGQRKVSAVNSGLIFLLEPVFAAILGVFYLNETLSSRELFGMFAMFSAALLTVFQKQGEERTLSPPVE